MKCSHCGNAKLKRSKEKHRIGVGKILFVGEIAVMLCAKCGESYASAEALREFERRVAQRLAEKGPVTGETFRFMRKAIGLPAKEVAELLSTTPETVSRWETGGRDVDRNAWTTLSTLVLDELAEKHQVRDRLRGLKTKPPAKRTTVKLDLASVSAR